MPKAKPLERNLQATAIRKFKALRARDKTFVFRKRHGTAMGIAGDPDFYGAWDGVHWELELKAPGGKRTRLQQARGKEWADAGVVYGIVYDVAGIDAFIEDLAEDLSGNQTWRPRGA